MTQIRFTPPTNDPAYAAACAVIQLLQNDGYQAYIIGGGVRDTLLGLHPKDYDIATNATPEQVHALPGLSKATFTDSAQAYGVSRVRLADWPEQELEVATFRRDIDAHKGRKATTVAYSDLPTDVQRRDFTINAIVYDPLADQLIDHVGGLADITQRRLRFIGEPAQRLREDPLRLLRAIRFKNSLHLDYDPATATALQQAVAHGLLADIATDRLRQELSHMLVDPSRRQAVVDLDTFGILSHVLPEVTRGKGVAQPAAIHAEGDVWTHQLLAIAALPKHISVRLAWATLLHDIGKPATQSPPHDDHDRIHFNRHYAVGAEMARGLLLRFNFSNKAINDICWMIEHHLSIDELPMMRPGHQRTMLAHPAFADLLALHRADAQATWPPSGPPVQPLRFPAIEALWHHYQTTLQHQPAPSLKQDLGIDGDWVQAHFGEQIRSLPPTVIGAILSALQDAYINHHVTSTNELTKRAEQVIADHSKAA